MTSCTRGLHADYTERSPVMMLALTCSGDIDSYLQRMRRRWLEYAKHIAGFVCLDTPKAERACSEASESKAGLRQNKTDYKRVHVRG